MLPALAGGLDYSPSLPQIQPLGGPTPLSNSASGLLTPLADSIFRPRQHEVLVEPDRYILKRRKMFRPKNLGRPNYMAQAKPQQAYMQKQEPPY